MRLTASRAQRKLPVTLIANMRAMRSALMSATRVPRSTTPALLTSAVRRPSSRSTVWKSRTTSVSDATSACTAIAFPRVLTNASAAFRFSR
jgi:hypothetical protein